TVALLVGSCPSARQAYRVNVGPFTKANMLFYEYDAVSRLSPDSVCADSNLSWLTLDLGRPKMITAIAFDERNRWLPLERRPSLWSWSSSNNIDVLRTDDGPTVRVTMTSGQTGWLKVESHGFQGDIKVLRRKQ
ncbi:MAG: hypothetical protein ABIK62_07715, partial [candidate division WOR-3 bacterium]